MERKWSIELLAEREVHVAAIVGVLTEHCPIGIHVVMLKIIPDPTVQDPSRHFLLHRSVFVKMRLTGFNKCLIGPKI